jgi:hypothetical protein
MLTKKEIMFYLFLNTLSFFILLLPVFYESKFYFDFIKGLY